MGRTNERQGSIESVPGTANGIDADSQIGLKIVCDNEDAFLVSHENVELTHAENEEDYSQSMTWNNGTMTVIRKMDDGMIQVRDYSHRLVEGGDTKLYTQEELKELMEEHKQLCRLFKKFINK